MTVTDVRGSEEPSGRDLPDDATTSGVVVVDEGPVTGTLDSPSDHDWFAVSLAPGRTYRFTLESPGDSRRLDVEPQIRGLRDANGNPVSGTGNATEFRFTTNGDSTDTVYYVAVGGTSGQANQRDLRNGMLHGRNEPVPFSLAGLQANGYPTAGYSVLSANFESTGSAYTVRVDDVTNEVRDDLPADDSTTGIVTVGGSVTGFIDSPDDRDWFAVRLRAGQVYQIDLEGEPTGAGTLQNPLLHGVYSRYGNPVTVPPRHIAGTTNDDINTYRSDFNSRVQFMPRLSTTYYVSAGTSDGQSGTYKLSIYEFVGEVADSPSTTGTLVVGSPLISKLDYHGDRDWFAVTLKEGKVYRFALEGWKAGVATLYTPYIHGIYRADGTYINGTSKYNNLRSVYVWFTPDEGGTYYVSAGHHETLTLRQGLRTYRLSVTELSDDFVDSTATTGVVEVGGSARGEIELRYDRDWFGVALEAGKTYQIDLKGASSDDGTLRDPYLRGLHRADGRLIANTTNDAGGTGHNSRLTFKPQVSGTYYVAAGGHGDSIGTYRLSVAEIKDGLTDDFTADTSTTGTVEVGGTAAGEIETSRDRDWFAVTLESGKTYRIDLEGLATNAGTLRDPYLHGLHNASGRLLAGTKDNDQGVGRNSRVQFTATQDATHYVAAAGYENWTGTYTLSVTELADDYTPDTDTTGILNVGGSATGEIEFEGDRDWFAVTLQAGRTYWMELKGARSGDGSLRWPHLRGIHNSRGSFIRGTSDDFGRDGYGGPVAFTPPATATYYVVASDHGTRTGTYRLYVRDVTDDFADDTETTGTIQVGGSTTGKIEISRDRDWFAVTLETGKTYQIDLQGASTGQGTLEQPRLTVYDARGHTILEALVAGANPRLLFTPLEDATYYAEATGSSSYFYINGTGYRWINSTGTYTLSVTDVSDSVLDDFAAGTATTGTVEVGGSATGELEVPGDRDWFRVTLEGGRTYRIDLQGSATDAGNLYNPYVPGIYDADGNLIAFTTNNDGGETRDAQVYFMAPASGIHYVAAGAFGYRKGTYTLSVTDVTEDIPDDFAAGTWTTDAVQVGGSVRGEIETAGNLDRFAVSLEAGRIYRIDLEGLDTGAGTLEDPYLYGVYDTRGNRIDDTRSNDGGVGRNSRIHFTLPHNATYYVIASGYDEGTYTLSLTDVTDSLTDDFAAGTGTTGRVEVDGSADGVIDYVGDRDWFAVTLEAGRTYRIDMEGRDTGAGTLTDPHLFGIHDASGTHLSGQFDRSIIEAFSRVTFTAPANGTYYVSAGADGYMTGTYTGTYTLLVMDVTDGIHDDYSAEKNGAGTVAVGVAKTGSIDVPEDRDWFAVNLQAGKTYQIDLEGSDTAAGTLRNPVLRGIHDAHGTLIANTVDYYGGEGRNSRVTFFADGNATYYVAVGSQISNVRDHYHEGTYTLSVADVSDRVTDDFLARHDRHGLGRWLGKGSDRLPA